MLRTDLKHTLFPCTTLFRSSYEMVEPKVQQRGDVAVLTFNLVSHARRPTGDTITVRWNSTEVYARSRGKWSIIHSHWSRSEEHTSELQSHHDLVCRLLLEKK